MLKATGREQIGIAEMGYEDFINNIPLQNDSSALQNYTQTYEYDELGNILQMKKLGAWTKEYFYNFDENNYLLKHDENGINTYEYDAHGNMTKMPHLQELKWDYQDNFKEATLDLAGNKAYYVYDASGNRVRKIVKKGSIIEDRIYIGNYEIYRKTTSGTLNVELETLNIMDDKQKIAQIDSEAPFGGLGAVIRYQLSDHLGSASLELGQNADIISYEEYYPFGTTSYRSGRTETEVSQKRYKYVMKELDNETGLYYYEMRYYASWICRFISVDPISKSDYFLETPEKNKEKITSLLASNSDISIYNSPYNYVDNNPIIFIDYNGEYKIIITDTARENGVNEETIKFFETVVNNISKLLEDRPDVLVELSKQTGFTEDELKLWTKPGEGPEIYIDMNVFYAAQAPKESSYFIDGENEIINHPHINVDFSLIKTYSDTDNMSPDDKSIITLAFMALILHETTHYGDRMFNNSDENNFPITGQSDGEVQLGKQWAKISITNHRGNDVEHVLFKNKVKHHETTKEDSFDNEGNKMYSFTEQTISYIKGYMRNDKITSKQINEKYGQP